MTTHDEVIVVELATVTTVKHDEEVLEQRWRTF